MIHDTFRDWIKHELEKRYWTYNELGRHAGLSSATISMVMSGRRNPGLDFCLGIARAFGVDPVTVLYKSGLIPGRSLTDEQTREILHLFDNLTSDDQERLLVMMRSLRDRPHTDTGKDKGGIVVT